MQHPSASSATISKLKSEISSRIETARGVVPGDLVDRTSGLRDLLTNINSTLSLAASEVKDQTGLEVNFDYDGKYKNGSIMVMDPVGQGRFTLPTKSHARWDEDDLLKIRQSQVLKPLLDKVFSIINEKDIRAQLVVANAISRILKLAREATLASSSEVNAALSPETMVQVDRMLDAIELQLSLELDKIERKADKADGSGNALNYGPTKDNPLDAVISCLDDIMRGEGEERINAVIKFHEDKLFNLVTSGTLVRTLDAVYRLIKGTSTSGWITAYQSIETQQA